MRKVEFAIALGGKIRAHAARVRQKRLGCVPHRAPAVLSEALSPEGALRRGGCLPIASHELIDPIWAHPSYCTRSIGHYSGIGI